MSMLIYNSADTKNTTGVDSIMLDIQGLKGSLIKGKNQTRFERSLK